MENQQQTEQELQPKKTKKPIWKKWWVWVIAIFIIIIIASAGGEKEKTKPIVEEPIIEEKEEVVEKKWVKVISLTANANKQSGTFYLKGGQQKVLYSVSDEPYGMCTIYVMKEGTDLMTHGGFPIVTAEGGMTDETMMRKSAGNYYLDLLVANATCVVEIYEYR